MIAIIALDSRLIMASDVINRVGRQNRPRRVDCYFEEQGLDAGGGARATEKSR